MTEKLKYKVGDKVLVEAEVVEVEDDGDGYPYELEIGRARTGWMTPRELEHSIVDLPPKPKVTQAVMDWCEAKRETGMIWNIARWLDTKDMPKAVSDWLFTGADLLLKQHALATLIAYGPEAVEVEKEKRYRVYLVGVKNQWNQRQCLTNNEDNYFFSGRCMVDTTYTKQEIIKAGFGDVFDNPMFEVEEVE